MRKAGAAYAQVEVESRAQWRAWLEAHDASSLSIWMVTFRKASGCGALTSGIAAENRHANQWRG
jgi:hypothetical protein